MVDTIFVRTVSDPHYTATLSHASRMPDDDLYKDGKPRTDVEWNGNQFFMKASGTVS